MTDVVDAITRSRMMSGIRGRDTAPEMLVRRSLHAAGYRFRLHDRKLSGTPDLVLPRYRALIFVHGCFWHRHSCPFFRLPKTNTSFWQQKIDANVARDEKARMELLGQGWRVATVWECATRSLTQERLVELLSKWLKSGSKELSLE